MLIVGLVAIVASRDESPASEPEPDPRWIVTELPDGWRAQSAAGPEAVSTDPNLLFVETRVYATAEGPAGPIVATSWQPETDSINQISPGSGFSASNYSESVLDGRRIVFADGPTGQRFLYVELGDQWALVQARGLDDALMETIATALDVDAANDLVLDPGAIPVVGMTYQGNPSIGAVSPAPGSTMSAYGAQSSQSSDPLGRMSLHVTKAPSAESAWLGLESGDVTPIDIDGVSAVEFVFGEQDTMRRILYWQRGGLDFTILGVNVEREALLAAAASVRQATEEEWSRLPRHLRRRLRISRYRGTVGRRRGTADRHRCPSPGGAPRRRPDGGRRRRDLIHRDNVLGHPARGHAVVGRHRRRCRQPSHRTVRRWCRRRRFLDERSRHARPGRVHHRGRRRDDGDRGDGRQP